MQRGLCGAPVVLTYPRKMTCVHPIQTKNLYHSRRDSHMSAHLDLISRVTGKVL
jgi:hypothetical protein